MFYLMVAIGGALGGIFVSLIAPLIFNGYLEFFVGLAMTMAALLTAVRAKQASPNAANHRSDRARFVLTVFTLATVMLAVLSTYFSGAFFSKQNFYGVIRVRELLPAGSTEKAYVLIRFE